MRMEVKGLSFAYRPGRQVLREISFCAETGQFLCVLGPNGAGKSTLFRCILGLLSGYSGQICIDGRDIRTISRRELAGHIAYIPQMHRPAFGYTVLETVLMGVARFHSFFGAPAGKDIQRAEKALEQTGVLALRNEKYAEISGGEQQLTLLARALTQDAKILLLDEPTSALDYANRERIQHRLRVLARRNHLIIQSNHDPQQALTFATHIFALQGGK